MRKSASEADGVEMGFCVLEMADRLSPGMLNMFYKEKVESEGEEKKESERVNVERLLAIAMGWIGMSRKDFELCTPSEFTEIYNAWMERDLQKQQRACERMRWQSACLLQPYCKKVLQTKDLVRFDWEEEENDDAEKKEERKRLTREEVMARYEMLKKRMGLR